MGAAIVIKDLAKRFRCHNQNRPWTFQEAVIRGFRGLKTDSYLWALKGISFQVARGQMLGVIGRNGAGKSTLLRLIGGVGKPDHGSISAKGPIGALIDLGTGFHPDLTGRENIFINGVVSGLTRREVGDRFEKIIHFAELEDFIDSPLRTYSAGMQMRLAFSVAVHANPEILLIDEVLAVGDMAFQRKCLNHIDEFKHNGCAIVFVSHDLPLVSQICDHAIWLNNGELVACGPAQDVTNQYAEAMER
jgi:lipopolysaccharide transport system ATP-binding protein